MNQLTRISLGRVGAVGALIVLLAACGGGGGGSSGGGGTTAATFNVNAAWHNLLTVTQTWTTSGVSTIDSKTYGVSIAVAPGATAAFPVTGTTYAVSDSTAILSLGGLGIANTTSATYFDAATNVAAGTRDRANGGAATCTVATASVAPPTAAQLVGATGALQTFDVYDGCLSPATLNGKIGTSTVTWSLMSTGGVTFFCLNGTRRDLAGTITAFEIDCFEVAESGTLGTHARITVSNSSINVTATN